ncbi:hypothetical protein AMTR_s00110p00120920, partial [Amborella trichopoda]
RPVLLLQRYHTTHSSSQGRQSEEVLSTQQPMEDVLVRKGRLIPKPRSIWPKVNVLGIDFVHLYTVLLFWLESFLTSHEPLRKFCDRITYEITTVIIDGIRSLLNQSLLELWNSLRSIAETNDHDTRNNIFARKAPTFKEFEMPRFYANLLFGIGPLHIEDSLMDTIIIYAPAQERGDNYRRTKLP